MSKKHRKQPSMEATPDRMQLLIAEAKARAFESEIDQYIYTCNSASHNYRIAFLSDGDVLNLDGDDGYELQLVSTITAAGIIANHPAPPSPERSPTPYDAQTIPQLRQMVLERDIADGMSLLNATRPELIGWLETGKTGTLNTI